MPAIAFKPLWLILAGAGIAAMIVLAWNWHGRTQYAAGHAQAIVEAKAAALVVSEQYRAQEAAAQQDAEANYAKYRGMVLATQAGAAGVAAARDGLLDQLSALRRGAAARSAAVSRPDGTAGPDFIAVVAACAGRYDEVVGYAAKLSDQLIGLQGHVRTVAAGK